MTVGHQAYRYNIYCVNIKIKYSNTRFRFKTNERIEIKVSYNYINIFFRKNLIIFGNLFQKKIKALLFVITKILKIILTILIVRHQHNQFW